MRTIKKITKIAVGTVMLLAVFGLIAFGIILEPGIKISGWENLDKSKLTRTTHSVTLLDNEENTINQQISAINIYTPLDEINSYTIDAFVSTEDKRFYSHNGIDYIRIASAIKNNILSGSYKEGASTITQQLVKNTHLSGEKKITRKLKEMRIATDIERTYSKSEILEMYLNILYFGNNIYGVGTAAKIMFHKTPKELTLSESALLAGTINNPHRFSPYANPENAVKRRNLVLSRMLTNKNITQSEYESAITESINVEKLTYENTQFYYNVIKEASEILKCNDNELYKKNLTICTNLDIDIQKTVQKALNSDSMSDIILSQVVVINNLTGNIAAICANTKQNLAYVKRQPGSVIKPVLSYAPALEKNIVVPFSPIEDTKINFGAYSPSNYREKYEGWTSVQNSLIHSSNVCAVKLLEKTGINTAKNYAENCGYTFSKTDSSLALALGGMTDGVTLNQIANSYQVFSNDGIYIKSGCIKYIKDSAGKIIYRRKADQRRVFSPETAFYINDMLASCAQEGTARLMGGTKNICAKTGTVGDKDGNTDAYCVAYNPEYTVAVWYGTKDSKQKMRVNGGGHPTLLAKKIFDNILGSSGSEFNRPNTIIEVDIDINEFYSNHKLLAASEDIPLKDRQKGYFTSLTRPREYSFKSNKNDSEEFFSENDIDNFEVA